MTQTFYNGTSYVTFRQTGHFVSVTGWDGIPKELTMEAARASIAGLLAKGFWLVSD